MQWKLNLTRWFVYEWKKPLKQKPHRINLRSLLSRIHYYQNNRLQVKESQYLIPTYSWTLTPIPNWTCSVVTISHFQCMAPSMWLNNQCTDPSTWLTHQLEKNVGCKAPHDKDQETPWLQNRTAYKCNNFFKKKMN